MTTDEVQRDTYPVVVRPDRYGDGSFCYVATHPDLPGCVGYGATLSEAKRKLANAREAYLTEWRRRGEEPPEPSEQPSVEWLFDDGAEGDGYATSSFMMVRSDAVEKVTAT